MIRKGTCQPDKCKSACCKVLHQYPNKLIVDNTILEINDGVCNKLKNNKCLIHNNKPKPCKDFPLSPDDPIYKLVKDKCTFWFE